MEFIGSSCSSWCKSSSREYQGDSLMEAKAVHQRVNDPVTVSFLNEPHAAYSIARRILCKMVTSLTSQLNVGALFSTLSHDLIRVIIRHNVLQEYQIPDCVDPLVKLPKDVVYPVEPSDVPIVISSFIIAFAVLSFFPNE